MSPARKHWLALYRAVRKLDGKRDRRPDPSMYDGAMRCAAAAVLWVDTDRPRQGKLIAWLDLNKSNKFDECYIIKLDYPVIPGEPATIGPFHSAVLWQEPK
jgi:hypothetical protein